MCPAPIMIMKYEEKPHARAANREVDHRNFMQRHMMKKPSIIEKRRPAGSGSQRENAFPIQARALVAGYDGAIWKLGIPPNRESVQRVVSPVASRKAAPS